MDLLDRLLAHDRWATVQLLERCQNLTDAQLDQPFDVGHGTLRATLSHTIGAVGFWTAQMGGEAVPADSTDRPSISALLQRHERLSTAFSALARRVREDDLLDETFIDNEGRPTTIGTTILHVAYHSSLHRGEARHILERLGVEDLWDGDPQEWEWSTAVQGA